MTENIKRKQELIWLGNARRARATLTQQLPQPEHVRFLDFEAHQDALARLRNASDRAVPSDVHLDDRWPQLERLWTDDQIVVVVPIDPTDAGALAIPFWYVRRYRDQLRQLLGAFRGALYVMSPDGSRGFAYDPGEFDDQLRVWGQTDAS